MRFLSAMVMGLVLVSAGCAGPQRGVLPPGDDLPDGHRVLRVGDFVELELESGEVVLGEVKEVGPDHVVLGRVGNFGYVEETIPADEIVSIALNGGETAGSASLKIGGILLVTALAFAMAFVAFGSVGRN